LLQRFFCAAAMLGASFGAIFVACGILLVLMVRPALPQGWMLSFLVACRGV
jgi:hypothetical protein